MYLKCFQQCSNLIYMEHFIWFAFNCVISTSHVALPASTKTSAPDILTALRLLFLPFTAFISLLVMDQEYSLSFAAVMKTTLIHYLIHKLNLSLVPRSRHIVPWSHAASLRHQTRSSQQKHIIYNWLMHRIRNVLLPKNGIRITP